MSVPFMVAFPATRWAVGGPEARGLLGCDVRLGAGDALGSAHGQRQTMGLNIYYEGSVALSSHCLAISSIAGDGLSAPLASLSMSGS
jgi:hypothetical protein